LRGRNVLLRQRLAARPPHEICLCSVVLAELYLGVLRSAKPAKNRIDVDQFAAPFASLPFTDTAADVCAEIRHHLEIQGTPIGPYDLQIAAIALANGCTLVTHRITEFSRVPGLSLAD
jgi:tRNA(fMet)-specific endonuclease VapC